ncbi:hypothetical protein [Polyangium sorediatum]|uniref:Secreted protein n=1 Tax=Polyangium sorediatum TaxID=889274 RepID=A0ABT6P0R9_9BACT|nr:hypothetical protein [Polyangium sorediatum]MDI1434194.1 hypothetical protein [Polyangium sorediatum]
MKRRGPFIAIAVAVTVIIGVALLPQRAGSEASAWSSCADMDDVFAMCSTGVKNGECWGVPDEFADACEAGCVLGLCADQVTCTERNPIWCAPCNDMHGGPFWNITDQAEIRCDYKFGIPRSGVDKQADGAYHACYLAEVARSCPALAGTNWWERFRAAMDKKQ